LQAPAASRPRSLIMLVVGCPLITSPHDGTERDRPMGQLARDWDSRRADCRDGSLNRLRFPRPRIQPPSRSCLQRCRVTRHPLSHVSSWNVGKLVNHLGVIYSRVALTVSTRRTEAPSRSELPTAPDGHARLGWFAAQRTAVLAASSQPPTTPVWNWTTQSRVRPASGPAAWHTRRSSTAWTSNWRRDSSRLTAIPKWQPTRSRVLRALLPSVRVRIVAAGFDDSMHLHATDVPGGMDTEPTSRRPPGHPRTRESRSVDQG